MNKSPQHFERLVLVCIDSCDSEKRRILQHFSRSTVAPIGAKKKCKHFSSPRKKGTFGRVHGGMGRGEDAANPSRCAVLRGALEAEVATNA